MTVAFSWALAVATSLIGLTYAAPTFTSPFPGSYYARGVDTSSSPLVYVAITGVPITFNQTYPDGSTFIVGTNTPTFSSGGSFLIPASSVSTIGKSSFTATQNGETSAPLPIEVIRFDVQTPVSGGTYPPNTDITVRFVTSVAKPVFGVLFNQQFQALHISDVLTPSGPPGSYVGSYTIPAAAAANTYGLAIKFYFGTNRVPPFKDNNQNVININQAFSIGDGGYPPFPTSFVASSYIPVGQDFTVNYQTSRALQVDISINTTSGTTESTTSVPAPSGGGYSGSFILTADQLSQSGTVSFTLSQTAIETYFDLETFTLVTGPVTSTSPIYSYTVQGPPSIVGYDESASTYAIDILPAISGTTLDPTDAFTVVVTNTGSGASKTRYYTTTLINGAYTSDAFILSASDGSRIPAVGSYSLVLSSNGMAAPAITYTVLPGAPMFTYPLNNSFVPASAITMVSYIAGAPDVVSFDTTGASSFTNTSIPLLLESGIYQNDVIIYPVSGAYTIIMHQNGFDSLPLLLTAATAPVITLPLADSYNPLGTDLVISFTAETTALVTVSTTYNGGTISQTNTPSGSGAELQGSVTVPASRLTVPGQLSIVATQNTISSLPVVVNIGSQSAAPLITSLANGGYVLANTDLSFTYTATALTIVNLTATPYSGGSPLTPFKDAKSPALVGSVITGTFTIPALSVRSTLQIVLSQGSLTSEPLTVVAVVAPAISDPQNNSKIGINRAFNVSITSDTNLAGVVTVTLTKPDSSTASRGVTPVAGSGSVGFAAADIEQAGTYSLRVSQALPDGTTLNGAAVITLQTGDVPVISGLVTGINYTQNNIIAPVVQVPTAPDLTTVAVTVGYNGFTQTSNYPLTDPGNGTSVSLPIELNHPYNFLGNQREFAQLGKYTLSVRYNGVTSDSVTYTLVAADAPIISFPTNTEDPVTVSASSPLTVTYDSPPNYSFELTFTLTKDEGTRRMRRADPIVITSSPDAVNGGGSAVFEDPNAPTSSGTYTLSVTQLAPDGSSITGAGVTFPIVINAASGAAGRARKVRRLVRRSRCSKPETECPTASGSFECIDLTTELTSCGGCNADSKEGSPFDCTNIARAKGVGCANGQCVVFSCEGFSYIPNDSQSACIRRR